MAKKKKDIVEFRFYEIPQGECVLALLGDSWVRVYGHDSFRLHFHNLMEIGVCWKGVGDLYYDKEKFRYHDGMISVIPENYPHVTISDGEDTNFWEYIFIDPKRIIAELYPNNQILQNEIIEAINKYPVLLDANDNQSLYKLILAIMDEAREKKKYSNQVIHQYVRALVLELMRRIDTLTEYEELPAKSNNIIKIGAALEFINARYMDAIKVKDLADECSMSETHFRRMFEEQINMSPMDYLNLIRIQKACELMKKSNESMDRVAEMCGFATTSTFNRNFKKFLDTSPYQWKINPDNYESRLLNYNISALKGW